MEHLPGRTAKHIGKHLLKVFNIYHCGGYKVQTMLMDNEFNKVADELPQLIINTIAANEHVGEVEWHIPLIEKHAWGILATLSFKSIPKIMLMHLIHCFTMWLNAFPVKLGISNQWSPRELVSGTMLNPKLDAMILFGAYCHVHDEPTHTNSMPP